MAQEVLTDEMRARTAGDLIHDVVREAGTMIRSEVQLAKAEVSEQISKAGKSAALLSGAAVAGLLCGMAVVAVCISALSLAMPVWAAAIIVAALLGILAGLLYRAGRARLRETKAVPERTSRTLKEDLQWAKRQTR
jgi:MFS family permease